MATQTRRKNQPTSKASAYEDAILNRVGIRELRQEASKIIDRVEAGEEVFVTKRGRVVGKIIPVESELPSWDELVAKGEITLSQKEFTGLKIGPIPWKGKGLSPSQQLIAERGNL